MKTRLFGLLALAALLAACSSPSPAPSPTATRAKSTSPSEKPSAGASAPSTQPAASPSLPGSVPGSASYTLPPFGTNVHIEVANWPSAGTSAQNAAITADVDYQLDYLYAEYTGGVSQLWMNDVSQQMVATLQQGLAATDVTTESFTGTILYFDFSAIPDPTITADVDVSGCEDTAGALNTDIKTGAVLPDQSVTDNNYSWFQDELAPTADGGWQVVNDNALVYYPQGLAISCKPGA
jgi:hypothetical protein